MKAKSRNTLNVKMAKTLMERYVKDAPDADQEVALVAVVVEAVVEAAVELTVPMRPREVAHQEKKEPMMMVMQRRVMVKRPMEEIREEEIAEDVAEVKAMKKSRTIEKTAKRGNTLEVMEQEHLDVDVLKQPAENLTQMMPIKEEIEEVAAEVMAKEDTEVTDRMIERMATSQEAIDLRNTAETETETTEEKMEKPVNLAVTSVVEENLRVMEKENLVNTVDLVAAVDVVMVNLVSIVADVVVESIVEVAEVAVAVEAMVSIVVAVAEAEPLTEKETSESLSMLV